MQYPKLECYRATNLSSSTRAWIFGHVRGCQHCWKHYSVLLVLVIGRQLIKAHEQRQSHLCSRFANHPEWTKHHTYVQISSSRHIGRIQKKNTIQSNFTWADNRHAASKQSRQQQQQKKKQERKGLPAHLLKFNEKTKQSFIDGANGRHNNLVTSRRK